MERIVNSAKKLKELEERTNWRYTVELQEMYKAMAETKKELFSYLELLKEIDG